MRKYDDYSPEEFVRIMGMGSGSIYLVEQIDGSRMTEEQTRQPTHEEQINYLQGQIQGLGSICAALIKVVFIDTADRKAVIDKMTKLVRGAETPRKGAYKASLDDTYKFLISILD